jgi:hypothetical protein
MESLGLIFMLGLMFIRAMGWLIGRRYSIIIFDRERPPADGDTITVTTETGVLIAEFKRQV